MASLARWNLEFDDSGGDALMDTPAGVFARLTAEAAAKGLEPPTLLALLKHPLFRLGGAQGSLKPVIEVLELALLRGTRPQAGSGGLAHDFERFRNELGKLRRQRSLITACAGTADAASRSELDRAQALIAQLQRALAPLESLRPPNLTTLSNWRSAIAKFSTALSSDQHGIAIVFEERAGSALASAFDDLLGNERPSGLMVQLVDYPEVFQTAFADRMVRRPESAARAPAYLWPVRGALDRIRSRHSRRACRGRLAAGAADRPMA